MEFIYDKDKEIEKTKKDFYIRVLISRSTWDEKRLVFYYIISMVKEDAEYSTKEEKEEKEEDKIKQYKAAKMFKLLKIYDNRSIPLIKDEADWQEFENILKKNELKVMA